MSGGREGECNTGRGIGVEVGIKWRGMDRMWRGGGGGEGEDVTQGGV